MKFFYNLFANTIHYLQDNNMKNEEKQGSRLQSKTHLNLQDVLKNEEGLLKSTTVIS